MAVFITGILGIAVFYLLILAVGFWASKKAVDDSEEEMILAGRKLGFTVGGLSLIATWVGGGHLNGTCEVMLNQGLVWAQVPIGYGLCLIVGALLYVKPLRDAQVLTLLDPFQKAYGNAVGTLLFFPSLVGDAIWIASTLFALGASLGVITGVEPSISVLVSAVFVAAYTSVGTMYSVSYTDVAQMFLIIAGLVLAIPLTLHNGAVSMDKLETTDWFGKLEETSTWIYLDTMASIIFGGICYQAFFQRVLAIKSTKAAVMMSVVAAFGTFAMAVPSATIGVIARHVNWTIVPDFNRTFTADDGNIILPLALRYLIPEWAAFFGLGALSAAAMSSADSNILGSSSYFARNVYKNLWRPKAPQKEVAWVLRGSILVVSAISAAIAIAVPNNNYLSVLSADLIYVITFPNLTLIIYTNKMVNSYGCVLSFVVGIVLRVLGDYALVLSGGEPGLGIPATIHYPGYDPVTGIQHFPHRTIAMCLVFLTHIVASRLAEYLFTNKIVSCDKDILQVFSKRKVQVRLDDDFQPNTVLLSRIQHKTLIHPTKN